MSSPLLNLVICKGNTEQYDTTQIVEILKNLAKSADYNESKLRKLVKNNGVVQESKRLNNAGNVGKATERSGEAHRGVSFWNLSDTTLTINCTPQTEHKGEAKEFDMDDIRENKDPNQWRNHWAIMASPGQKFEIRNGNEVVGSYTSSKEETNHVFVLPSGNEGGGKIKKGGSRRRRATKQRRRRTTKQRRRRTTKQRRRTSRRVLSRRNRNRNRRR